jgi:fibronectin-binding autotransporter adhesin
MKLIKRALAAVVALSFATSAVAVDNLPAGSIGTVDNPTANSTVNYSFNFTASTTGANYIGFAFRQDPAYWNFTNVTLTTGGGSNLLTNGAMTQGGAVNITTTNGPGQIQAPANWGVWYQYGTYPAAAGSWSGGSWYDGAVGTYDGIYQGVNLTSGTTYSIRFDAYSTSQASSTEQARIGVYAGACSNPSGLAAACSPNTASFSTLATPDQTVNAGNPTPTIVSSTTTNSVSTSTSNGATNTVTSTALGTAATVIALANARQGQTAQALSVRQTATATTTTPATYTTVATTPVTTTTTTTPVTTDTYSDGSTVVTNGSPVVTTSTTNSVVTTVTTGTLTSVATSNRDYSTRIDQYTQLSNINKTMNYSLDSGVLDRNRALGDSFNVSERNNFYVTGSASQSNTVSGYSYKSNTYGVGYDWQVASDWIIGGQFNRGQANLNGVAGTNAGGTLNKDHVGIYSAYTVNDWILKNDIGYATNSFDTNHSLPELAMSNTSTTKGQDLWATARVYTPEMFDFRPFVGVRNETNRRNGVTESGTALTAVTYGAVNNNKTSTDVGVRYDAVVAEDWRVTGEYAYNSQQFNTAYASVGYAIDPTSVVRLRYGYGKQYDYTVQSAMVEARFSF